MTKSDIIDLAMHLHAETAIAIKVSGDGNWRNAVWLPKAHVEFEIKSYKSGADICVSLPEWLAIEKGLL